MPFTPLHLGPGAAFKALGGRHFSFLVFGGSQVLMDIEPLIRILNGHAVLHGPSHTLVGALLIGALATVIGKPLSMAALRLSGLPHRPLSWLAACTGAFVGTFSHVGLDALMHGDLQPAWPWATANPLLGVISYQQIHLLCLLLAVLGGLLVVVRYWWRNRALLD